MGPMPLLPAIKPSQLVSVSSPMGVTMPTPVTTTLRFNEAPPAHKIRKAKRPSSWDRGAAFWLSERTENAAMNCASPLIILPLP
jgi:hypothetical protein